MTLKKALQHYSKLAIQNNREAEAIKWLILELSEYSPTDFYLKQDQIIDSKLLEKIDLKVKAYIFDAIPVQHLLGYAYFYGYKFDVNSDVLIPRCETEELVEHILIYYDSYFNGQKVDLIDLGTGSGCIATTFAKEEPNLNVMASDISESALDVARANAAKLEAKVNFVISDWWRDIDFQFDIIVANPPYIPSDEKLEEHVLKEPKLALFGGDNGLIFYEEILKGAKVHLKNRALIGFEHGYQHSDAIKQLVLKYFDDAIIVQKKDLQEKDRFTFIGFNGVLANEI